MKKFLVFLAEGFEEIEALTPVDYLRRAGIEVDTVSITDKRDVVGSHNIQVLADKTIYEINGEDYLGLYIPGGIPGAINLRDNQQVIDFIKEFNNEGKIVSAICAGPISLSRADIIRDKKVTSFPTFEDKIENIGMYVNNQIVVEDQNIITGRGAAIAIYESFKIIEKIKGKEAVKLLKEGIQQTSVEDFYKFQS